MRAAAREPELAPLEIDLDDSRVALSHRGDAELRLARTLFRALNMPLVARLGTALGPLAVRWGLPFAERIVLATVYRQFVGGRSLLEAGDTVAQLRERDVLSVLDYGAEGKDDETAYNQVMAECIRALEYAADNPGIPVVSTKLSGLASNALLETVSTGRPLTADQDAAYRALSRRVESLCHVARQSGVQLYVDAEESWLQPAIDKVVLSASLRYNRGRAVIFNTYQLYRHDRLAALYGHHAQCRSRAVVLGAKLVRGAYLEKERERAAELGLPSPIHASKAATDRDFDLAVAYCLDHLADLEFVNASHNQQSALAMLEAMAEREIARGDRRTLFCQLYGMSDSLTFNLAEAGYRVAKYVPYGPVREVVPYLVRRARENSSVDGEMSRELRLIERELTRRQAA